IIEQAVRIILVLCLAGGFAKKGISFAVAAVMVGDAVAEAVSCFILYLSYQADKRKVPNSSNTQNNQGFREILRIATPITAGRYLNSGLRTAENILVPKSLNAFGAASALSQFGMIKGMALPLLFFPSSFLTAISTLLVPEMSEAATKKQDYKIRFASERTITITASASFLIGALFFALSKPLGMLFYESYEVSYLLRALAPIVPLMYIDSICDGMLKGLDKQSFVFWLSVSDSAARLVAVPLVVSRFGMTGFLFIMVISNLYTASLRVWKLLSTAKTPFNIGKWLIKPLLSATLCAVTASFIYNALPFSAVISVIISIFLSSGVYIGFLFLLGGINREDISIF
ncbi:MAG: polysaccharide biosynthesis C-terminal domain-containing protein, partial [Clostridia bacterium]|nr:polysaccharide biosynthesis C-terminal domain-containing protein [Clostridia bacterium]